MVYCKKSLRQRLADEICLAHPNWRGCGGSGDDDDDQTDNPPPDPPPPADAKADVPDPPLPKETEAYCNWTADASRRGDINNIPTDANVRGDARGGVHDIPIPSDCPREKKIADAQGQRAPAPFYMDPAETQQFIDERIGDFANLYGLDLPRLK
jgi:hypothetical protein